MPTYTRTQQRILATLSDGLPHTAEELRPCLYDDMGGKDGVAFHISKLRKIMKESNVGETIVCELSYRRTFYRHVRLISSRAE
jgi:hypothetical protein